MKIFIISPNFHIESLNMNYFFKIRRNVHENMLEKEQFWPKNEKCQFF